MTPDEQNLDMLVAELDRENRLLRARNERLEREAEQPAQQEPIYQYQMADGSWIDQAKHSYDYNKSHAPNAVLRIVYTSPPAQRTWVGLTKEEREHIWHTVGNSDAHGDVDGWSGRDVMEAIEAKLREKNQ